MEKDFYGWAKIKQRVHERKQASYFSVGQIWWCSLGANVGTEQDGKGPAFLRPVVILTKFNEHSCLVVPLTGRERYGRYYDYLGEVSAGRRLPFSRSSALLIVEGSREGRKHLAGEARGTQKSRHSYPVTAFLFSFPSKEGGEAQWPICNFIV